MAGSYTPKLSKARKYKNLYLIPTYIFFTLYLISALLFWFFVRSPFFRINKIEVVGNSTVSETDVVALLESGMLHHNFFKSVLGFNNFLTWPNSVSSLDLAFLPAVKDIEITKNYHDHTLTLKVGEREAFGIWCMKEDCWWFDDSGAIFRRAVSSEGSLINTVKDDSQSGLGLNSKILPGEFLGNAISIFKVLRESGLSIKEINLKDLSLREIQVSTYDGPKIYFSLSFPADTYLQVITDFRAKPGFKNLEYMDFRVENKLYYK